MGIGGLPGTTRSPGCAKNVKNYIQKCGPKWLEKAGHVWKWLKMAINDWNGWKWLEKAITAGMAQTSLKLL